MPDENTEKKLQEFVESQEKQEAQGNQPEQVGPKIAQVESPKLPNMRSDDQISQANQVGWQKIPIKDLPTMGFFYPEGTEVVIRAATANEVRHWSTLQDNDISSIDDMMNYVLERCVGIKYPNNQMSSWKDIKEIDRFYILLAIREYTFVKGENNLQIKVSENEKVNVSKEMIDYITFDDKIMKYYDDVKRYFVLKFKTGKEIEVTIPSTGVTAFLKSYIKRKQESQERFDQDFVSYAPFVIKDWRGLNDNTYEQMVLNSTRWSIDEISVLTHIKDLFVDAINPVIKYTDEGGAEQTAPLNFLGGIKSIFLISDPFGQLV